jgi:predicted dehydrogenase
MKPLKVAVVGAAARGKSFFSAISCNPNAELTALCDINEEGLRNAGNEGKVEHLYTDYEEMLDKAEVDIVLIGTPMHFHAPQSIMALERDIHVISEVTAAVSAGEAKELVLATRNSKAMYAMAENYCYMRNNVLVREIARKGLFGELYFAEGAYIHELKGLNERTPWRRKWQAGVPGCTYGTHSLGPVYQWTGERVVSVSCTGSGHHYKDPRSVHYETDDTTTMLCRMEKGGLIQIRVDMLSNRPHNMTCYSLQGTKGCYESARGLGDKPKIWLDSKSEKMEWMPLEDLAEEFLPEIWKNPSEEQLAAGHGGGDYLVVKDFIQAIINHTPPPIGIHEAMDMTLPGLISQQSILQNSAWLPVPDSREWK